MSSLGSQINSDFESKVQIFKSFYKIMLLFCKMLQFSRDDNTSLNDK